MAIIRRLGFLLIALAFAAVRPLSAQGLTASGPHANEAFCKTMITQYVSMQTYMRASFGRETDPKTQARYFADQKSLNALLVKTAPSSLSADMTLIDRDLKKSFDAMQHADRGHLMAAMAPMRTPEHLNAAQRARAYCGLKATK